MDNELRGMDRLLDEARMLAYGSRAEVSDAGVKNASELLPDLEITFEPEIDFENRWKTDEFYDDDDDDLWLQ